MTTKLKILSESHGVTRVTETSGARRGDDLFVEGVELGRTGEIIELPEFRLEDIIGELAKQYYAE